MSKTFTYQYVSDYAVVLFDVVGEDDWTEEQFDSASEFDILDYAKNGKDFYLDDCWDKSDTNNPHPNI
jgi:hypothetical protein